MQCPHQEEKNWTSQAEDEFVTVDLRLPLLRMTSGSSSVYRRAAARTHPGTSHRTNAALNHKRSIPSGRQEVGKRKPGDNRRGAGDFQPTTDVESRVDMRATAPLTSRLRVFTAESSTMDRRLTLSGVPRTKGQGAFKTKTLCLKIKPLSLEVIDYKQAQDAPEPGCSRICVV